MMAAQRHREAVAFDGLAADMWSCGVCLFLLLAGFPPVNLAWDSDERYALLRNNGVSTLVRSWKLPMSAKAIDLLTQSGWQLDAAVESSKLGGALGVGVPSTAAIGQKVIDGEVGVATGPESATGKFKTKLSASGLVYKHYGREILCALYPALADALEKNTTLTTLDLGCTSIPESARRAGVSSLLASRRQ